MKSTDKLTFQLIIFLLLISINLLLLYEYISAHEEVHSTIYDNYGINNTVKINIFSSSYTETESGCYSENCKIQQNLTEIVGYHLMPFFSMFLAFLTIISFLLFQIVLNLQNKNDNKYSNEKK